MTVHLGVVDVFCSSTVLKRGYRCGKAVLFSRSTMSALCLMVPALLQDICRVHPLTHYHPQHVLYILRKVYRDFLVFVLLQVPQSASSSFISVLSCFAIPIEGFLKQNPLLSANRVHFFLYQQLPFLHNLVHVVFGICKERL